MLKIGPFEGHSRHIYMNRADKRQLLADHYLDFYSLAMAMLHDEDDACDAVQEALVTTLTRPVTSDPVHYCFQTLRHEAVNIMRRRMKIRELQEGDSVEDPERNELLNYVSEVYKRLPKVMRTMVQLYDIDGYTYSEVARIMRSSKTTVRRTIEKAHEIMRTKIEPEL